MRKSVLKPGNLKPSNLRLHLLSGGMRISFSAVSDGVLHVRLLRRENIYLNGSILGMKNGAFFESYYGGVNTYKVIEVVK
jgi:hypothetical protein